MSLPTRQIILLILLVILAAFYFYQNPERIPFPSLKPAPPPVDLSASLPLGEETKAKIRHYFEGIEVQAEENNLDHAIHLDHGVGRIQFSEGKYQEAYRTYQKVLAISYKQGSLMGIAIGLGMLSNMFERAGNTEEALYTLFLAYEVQRAMGKKEESGVAEMRIANLLEKKDVGLALLWYLRARQSLKGTPYREDYVSLLLGLADSLRRLGERERASSLYEEAWTQAQTLGESPSEKWRRREAGSAYVAELLRQKLHDQALKVLEKMQSLFSDSEKPTEQYTNLLHQFAWTYSTAGQKVRARHYYWLAYANYELTRVQAPGEEARARLDNSYKAMIDGFVKHLLDSGDYAEALAILESNKARTLGDILEDPSFKEIYEQWKEIRQRQAEELVDLLTTRLMPPFAAKTGEISSTAQWDLFEKQRNELRRFQMKIQLREIAVTPSLSESQVREIQQGLPADVAILCFFMSDDRPYVFVLSRSRIQVIPLRQTSLQYRRAIEQLRVALTNPYQDFYREPARMLYREMLQPVLRTLPAGIKILVYSPDAALSRIPLQVLMDAGDFLIERYAVFQIPSLRYLPEAGAVRRPPAENGVACVDPEVFNARLPFQRETGQQLQNLYRDRVRVLTGSDCREDRLSRAIEAQRSPAFLHIGAHGNFYPANTMESAIQLAALDGSSDGQEWTAQGMAALDMGKVALITLSSCETGLTDPAMERDVFGIGRALFFAGAKTVVAPLWSVHDQATAEFMKAFYQSYSTGTPAVFSLQEASRQHLKTSRYRHPYYWSAFVLTGVAQ